MLNERSSSTMGDFQANNVSQMFRSLPPCGNEGKQKNNPPVRFHMDRKERKKMQVCFAQMPNLPLSMSHVSNLNDNVQEKQELGDLVKSCGELGAMFF